MIEIKSLSKRFGNFTAVSDLNINIGAGEFYGFLGPNGAGKTTTIKMMTGLFSPTSGSIKICGYDISRNPLEAKSTVGYIPDQPFLYEKLTGREFLFFSAGLYKVDHDLTTRRIEEMLYIFEIGAWIDQRTENYSQGMRQRIAIAAALLHNPKVLIIDEPMVGLDPRSAHIIKNIFKTRSEEGVTVFMSTHSLPVAEELCNRIGIVKDGRLIFDGPTSDILNAEKGKDGKFESVFLELTK
ncbi:MAG: ABC transporter ATP-binding protein [Ignavibacteriales bacterium]|nr:ABC transporter ATP-binding protein [Ignavibacteriales bacterium]